MATYYVSTSGNDLATGLTELLAFQHVDKAMNVVAAGDKVYVKGNGAYAELATIDTVGTNIAPVVFEGYTTTPGDGGRATITGSSSRTNCVANALGITYYVFKNFRFTAATEACFEATSCEFITFKNCKFDLGGNRGLIIGSVSCEDCEFISNATEGAAFSSTKGACFFRCTFYSNGTYGINQDLGPLVVFGCIFFSNASGGLTLGGNNTMVAIINCTIDGDDKDTDDGILIANTAIILGIVNSVFYDCGVGINQSTASRRDRVISRNNLVNANTTAYTNAATFTGEVTSAPQFTNEVGGANYTPAAGSPLINAGLNG